MYSIIWWCTYVFIHAFVVMLLPSDPPCRPDLVLTTALLGLFRLSTELPFSPLSCIRRQVVYQSAINPHLSHVHFSIFEIQYHPLALCDEPYLHSLSRIQNFIFERKLMLCNSNRIMNKIRDINDLQSFIDGFSCWLCLMEINYRISSINNTCRIKERKNMEDTNISVWKV